MKNSFAFAIDQQVYLSQHIGDLGSLEASHAYDREVASFQSLLNAAPLMGVCDKHPDYYTSHYVQKNQIPAIAIQHHKAHVFSAMLDNKLAPPLLGISWDGTGYGDDQTIWGAEAFVVSEKTIEHAARLHPFCLPGANKAVREPRRSALGVLQALYGTAIPAAYHSWLQDAFTSEELSVLAKGVNAPRCSSMGRLFDAVSALLGCCLVSQFEGHAALALEALALNCQCPAASYSISWRKEENIWVLSWQDMVQELFEQKMQGRSSEEIAYGFHLTLAEAIVQLAKIVGLEKVLLSGGVMQNKLLAELSIEKLKLSSFTPFWHHHIPPNDGGLAAGQILGSLFQRG